jgi:hypothetical protein
MHNTQFLYGKTEGLVNGYHDKKSSFVKGGGLYSSHSPQADGVSQLSTRCGRNVSTSCVVDMLPQTMTKMTALRKESLQAQCFTTHV